MPPNGALPLTIAAMGLSAMHVPFLLVGATARGGIEVVNDHTLGWRGVLLDHLFVWALGLTGVAVIGRQLLVVRARRRRKDGAARGAAP